jgi:hypothetical protein
MREDHSAYPHCHGEQMEKEREFDSFVHVVFPLPTTPRRFSRIPSAQHFCAARSRKRF